MVAPSAPVTAEQVGHHYDELDTFYRELWGLHVHHGLWSTGREAVEEAIEALVAHVAERAALRPHEAVCDVGCGYGEMARCLAEQQGVRVTGLTVSAVQHACAIELTRGDNPAFLLQDWLANTLPDASFDAVLAVESTSHMSDRARCFREAARVLRPDGRLVVCAWLAGDDVRPWQQHHLLRAICREGRLPALSTLDEYRRWIEAAGFVLDDVEDLSHRVRRTWLLVVRRVLVSLLTGPRLARYLLDATRRERLFVLTPLRLLLAYYTGAFRYVCFTAHRAAPRRGRQDIPGAKVEAADTQHPGGACYAS